MLPADPNVRASTRTHIAVASAAAQPQSYSSLARLTAPVNPHLTQIVDEHPKHTPAAFMGRRNESPGGVAGMRCQRCTWRCA